LLVGALIGNRVADTVIMLKPPESATPQRDENQAAALSGKMLSAVPPPFAAVPVAFWI